MDIDLDELERLMKATTPFPWVVTDKMWIEFFEREAAKEV